MKTVKAFVIFTALFLWGMLLHASDTPTVDEVVDRAKEIVQ